MPLHHWPNPHVPWRSFHNHWIVRLVEYLNGGILPQGLQARPTETLVGIEPDVLLLQREDGWDTNGLRPQPTPLSTATTTAVLPPPADWPMVGIYSTYDQSRLVAVIEVVSPGNKDRPEAIRAFVEKILFLLHDGIHVIIIDAISLPTHPLRASLLQRLEQPEAIDHPLWVSSFCAVPEHDPTPRLTVREWAYECATGKPLPIVPLFLHSDQHWVMVDLESTYQSTLSAGRYRPS